MGGVVPVQLGFFERQQVVLLFKDLYATLKRRRTAASWKSDFGNQDSVKRFHQKGALAAGGDGGQILQPDFVRVGDHAAHFSDHGVQESDAARDTLCSSSGNLLQDSRFQDLRRMVVVFSRVNDCWPALRLPCVAIPRPGADECCRGLAKCRIRTLGTAVAISSASAIASTKWHRPDSEPGSSISMVQLPPLDAVRVGDVHRETPSRSPHRLHNLRHDFRQPPAGRNYRTGTLRKETVPLEWRQSQSQQKCVCC